MKLTNEDVSLSDYLQLKTETQKTIEAQQAEIETLKRLLNQWLETQEITLTATFYPGMMEKYENIINDTTEVLK